MVAPLYRIVTSFNYAHSLRSACVDFIHSVGDRCSRRALIVTAVLLGASLSMLGVEAQRFGRIRGEATVARERFAASEGLLRRSRGIVADVDALSKLTQRVEAMRRSGEASAARIVAIANALPDDVWLTEVDSAAAGTVVKGTATSLVSLALATRSLTEIQTLSHPVVLEEASRLGPSRPLTYRLRLGTR